jgi:phosphatidylethanolamine-binding protein (PEBP) family uncharacterized protein
MKNKHLSFKILLSAIIFISSCKKSSTTTEATTETTTLTTSNFTASSTAFINNGAFPKLYTCDSTGISPKLSWANAPVGTKFFAVVMHHIPPSPPNHVYMLLYNIPVTITSIPDAVSGVGIFGQNTVNPTLAYTPLCSQGPGAKLYTITVYALSAAPVFSVAASAVTRDLFLAAIANTTLATSVINVTYTR